MIGAILAGGYGKRIRSFSSDTPKGLVPLKDGYTILHRQLFDLSITGIKDVYLLTGHLGEKIEQTLGEKQMGMSLHYLKEEKPMGTLFSVRNLISIRGDEDVLLRNGDTVSDINFPEFVRFAKDSDYSMVVCISRMRSPFGIVEFSANSVTSFVEKPLLDYYINSGTYYIKRNCFEYFRKDYLEKDLEKSAFPEIVKRGKMGVYREDAFWIGIDSEKEIETARNEYEGRTDYPWGFVRKRKAEGKVTLTEVYVKSGEKASIDCAAGSVFRVEDGACMIPPGEKLKPGSTKSVGPKLNLESLENVRALLIEP